MQPFPMEPQSTLNLGALLSLERHCHGELCFACGYKEDKQENYSISEVTLCGSLSGPFNCRVQFLVHLRAWPLL